MKLSSNIAKIVFLMIFLVTFFFGLGACEPMLTIRVHNQTDKTLKIFFGDAFIDYAAPEQEVKIRTLGIFPGYEIIAKDVEENVVYTANFTREDISGKKTYRVTIPPTAKSIKQSDNVTGR